MTKLIKHYKACNIKIKALRTLGVAPKVDEAGGALRAGDEIAPQKVAPMLAPLNETDTALFLV